MTTSLRDQLQKTLGAAYRLERELGGGGMSRVFVAEEVSLGRKVVVKVLPPDIAAGVSTERFKREIQLAARLQHPHIVPLLSAGEMDGVPYYTMPFVEGESVRARLARGGMLSLGEAIGILRDVAKALAYAHERGIVHRDIKPDNVLLSGDSATVADFGIAKAIAAARTDSGAHPETLTSIGASLGTPAYMAPEQAAADPSANHRADIYAFGCMAYELLAGRPPFVAKTPQRLLAAQMGETPEPITSHRPDTPPELAELVMRCLAKEPDDRPQSARDLVQVLGNVTSGSAAPMPSVLLSGSGMLRKALLMYAAAYVFVAVLAKAAIVAIGLPDWVFPGSLVVMALGLPVILFTAYVHRTTRQMVTKTPAFTPGGTPSSAHGTFATFAVKASPHVSWRRTWLGGVFAVGAFVVMIGAYMLLRALGVGPFGSLLAAGTLQKNEKLLVADFTSPTNDSTLGPVVTDAFRTALAQSRSISVFQPNEIRDVLRRMQKPAGTKVDYAVAREIATREGVKAVILGDMIALGGSYVISVQLVSPQTREELASFRETAKGEAELLPKLDQLAKDMRSKIGESLRQVQSTPPLERVTTPSLEALKKYVQGSRILSYEADFQKGAPLLLEAIALDTSFAMAYRRLAVEYTNRDRTDSGRILLQKAFDHSDRLSDAERYLVQGSYYAQGPKQDLEKSTSAYESLIDLQPDFTTALNNVAINYRYLRNWAKAEDYLRRAMAAGAAPAVVYNQLAWTYMNEGKMAEAWRVAATYDSVFPTNPQRYERHVELLAFEGRYDSAAAIARLVVPQVSGNPYLSANWRYGLGVLARTQGRLREASRWMAESAPLYDRSSLANTALDNDALEVVWRAIALKDPVGAAAQLDAAVKARYEKIDPEQRPYLDLALAYAALGRTAQVKEMQAAFERAHRSLVLRSDAVNRPGLRAALAYSEGRYADAAREFQDADRGECLTCALSWQARSYDRAGVQDSAIAVYNRYLAARDPFRIYSDQFDLVPAHERLGELYEAKGDVPNAVANYEKVLELWKNADPELQPRVTQIRARVARLKDTERK